MGSEYRSMKTVRLDLSYITSWECILSSAYDQRLEATIFVTITATEVLTITVKSSVKNHKTTEQWCSLSRQSADSISYPLGRMRWPLQTVQPL